MAEEKRYKRRTTRKVDVLMHTQMVGRPNNTACGLWKYPHPLAPQVFNAGDIRPDRVIVECPLCQAALVCADIDKKMAHKTKKNRKDATK